MYLHKYGDIKRIYTDKCCQDRNILISYHGNNKSLEVKQDRFHILQRMNKLLLPFKEKKIMQYEYSKIFWDNKGDTTCVSPNPKELHFKLNTWINKWSKRVQFTTKIWNQISSVL